VDDPKPGQGSKEHQKNNEHWNHEALFFVWDNGMSNQKNQKVEN
jgi:hypothetical protein